jgi:protein SCO1
MLLIAALVASCSAGQAQPQSQPTLAGVVRSQPLDVAAVSLPDAANGGTPLPMQAPDGELLLVYFGYTHCPDICPTTMSDISVALGDLPPALAERVAVAMVTVDPERDTDERLTDYMGYFFSRAHALRTTDPAELDEAARAFGVRWEVEDHEPGERYEVAHTAITYVVDDSGTVVVEWPFGFDTELMAADLELLLERSDT